MFHHEKTPLAGQIYERWPGLDGRCQVYYPGRSQRRESPLLEAPNWKGWSGYGIFTNIGLLFTSLFPYQETMFDQSMVMDIQRHGEVL